MFWMNLWQPTVHIKQNNFWKNYIEVGSSHLYASFCHLLRPNWSIVRGTVSLWKILENAQIAVFKGKCRRFSENLDAKGAWRSVMIWAMHFCNSFSKVFCCTWAGGCQRFVQYTCTVSTKGFYSCGVNCICRPVLFRFKQKFMKFNLKRLVVY